MSLAEFSEKVRKLKSNIAESTSQIPINGTVTYNQFQHMFAWNSDKTVLEFNPAGGNIVVGEPDPVDYNILNSEEYGGYYSICSNHIKKIP